jgi:hypothetical protein
MRAFLECFKAYAHACGACVFARPRACHRMPAMCDMRGGRREPRDTCVAACCARRAERAVPQPLQQLVEQTYAVVQQVEGVLDAARWCVFA